VFQTEDPYGVELLFVTALRVPSPCALLLTVLSAYGTRISPGAARAIQRIRTWHLTVPEGM
jgi:hypothetical protein